MRAFKEVDIAEACIPFEIVEWLYLGRIPEWTPDDNGNEARTSIRALTGDMYFISDGYSKPELDAYGVEVDIELYWDARSDLTVREGLRRVYIDEIRSWQEFQGPLPSDYFEKKSLIDSVDEAMSVPKERAQLRTLLALMEGQLVAHGFRMPSGWKMEDGAPVNVLDDGNDSWSDLFDRAKVEPIPASLWRNVPDVWNYGNGELHPPSFLGCWVSTSDVFRLFPVPAFPALPLRLEMYADRGIVAEGGPPPQMHSPSSVRGRKPKGDGLLQKALVFEFQRRLAAGELPTKKEAMIADCIKWVKDALGEDIGRSTAQRHLAQICAQK